MGNVTVVYYTSNREDEAFEAKIRAALLSVIGDLPLISVSQKPINFGENICVGEVGISNQNAHRQLQIGAQAAKTTFIAAAEADCLYPKNYFEFEPPVLNKAFRAPVWLLHKVSGFYKKPFSESATVVSRDFLIYQIEKTLKGRGMWEPQMEHGNRVPFTFGWALRFKLFEMFECDPIISMKTRRGMHAAHGYVGAPVDELPGWGSADKIRSEYGFS